LWHFGRFIWLGLYSGTRLSENLPHLYSGFFDIVAGKWGGNITAHVHRMDEFICVHFGRFIWLGLYSGARLSDHLPHLYNGFYDIVPAKWGGNIIAHMHRMDEFICAHFDRFIWLELYIGTRLSENLSHLYSGFYNIVAGKWGGNITAHVHRMDEFICAHFGRFIWLELYSGTRLSENLPHLYSGVYDIVPANWGGNIIAHVHRMNEFICAHFGRFIWLGLHSGTRLSDHLLQLYSGFYDIVPAKWGGNIIAHVHRMNEFICV